MSLCWLELLFSLTSLRMNSSSSILLMLDSPPVTPVREQGAEKRTADKRKQRNPVRSYSPVSDDDSGYIVRYSWRRLNSNMYLHIGTIKMARYRITKGITKRKAIGQSHQSRSTTEYTPSRKRMSTVNKATARRRTLFLPQLSTAEKDFTYSPLTPPYHPSDLDYPMHHKVKVCASCKTRKTPLWRDADDGTPYCNACGIRYRKYHFRCPVCLYIPRKEEHSSINCNNCGTRLFNSLR